MPFSLITSFAYPDVATRIGVSVALGLLVGLEREWAQKEVGARTFAITALLGALASLVSPEIVVPVLVGIVLLVFFLNLQSYLKDGSLELTTSAALMAMLIIGAVAGMGHYFTAVTAGIAIAMLLAWKTELTKFAEALRPEEIRSAVLLGLISFVVYPLLPDRFVDRWELLNPRQAWITVVVIAGIGFLNYVLLRIYSTKGIFYAAILGGLVNSTATVAELASIFAGKPAEFDSTALALILLTNVAMFIRNLGLLVIFSVPAIPTALPSMAVMTAATLLLVWAGNRKDASHSKTLGLISPLSLRRVAKFALLFVGLSAAGTLAQRFLGDAGFLVLSVVGGFVSSASQTASAATLSAAGKISPSIAGVAVVLTSIASTVVNLPIVHQQTRQASLLRRLIGASAFIVALGLLSLWATYR